MNCRHESEIGYNESARGFDKSVKAFDESLAIFHAIPTRQLHTFTSRKRWIDESFLKHLSRHTRYLGKLSKPSVNTPAISSGATSRGRVVVYISASIHASVSNLGHFTVPLSANISF